MKQKIKIGFEAFIIIVFCFVITYVFSILDIIINFKP